MSEKEKLKQGQLGTLSKVLKELKIEKSPSRGSLMTSSSPMQSQSLHKVLDSGITTSQTNIN